MKKPRPFQHMMKCDTFNGTPYVYVKCCDGAYALMTDNPEHLRARAAWLNDAANWIDAESALRAARKPKGGK